MKKIIAAIIFTVIIGGLNVQESSAQCNPDSYSSACLSKLKEGYTFLKNLNIDGQAGAKDKVEFSYPFSKDTRYFINICSEGADTGGIIVSIYDSNRKIVGTNFVNGKFFPGIEYPCGATGIYYITFTFEGSSTYCGSSVLGFKR